MKLKVEDLKEGDLVDLESCLYLCKHPTAEFEYAEVTLVEWESDKCVAVSYEGIGTVGYPVGTGVEPRSFIPKVYPKGERIWMEVGYEMP